METKRTVNGEISLIVDSELDIVNAREKTKWLAKEIGFQGSELTVLSTLISELVRKVVAFNSKGNVTIQTLERGTKRGIAISVSTIPAKTSAKHILRSDLQASNKLPYDQRLIRLAGKHVADEFEILPNGLEGIVVRVVKWM